MAWVMSVLGAFLALGGGVSLWNGSGYIRMDEGQAEAVAGTVALSAGVIAIGLAAVLFKLRDLAPPPARAAARDAPAAAPGRFRDRLATVGLPKAEAAAAVSAPAADLDEPFTDSHPLHGPTPLPAEPEPAPAYVGEVRAVPEAPRAAAPAPAEAPTVVGRYEANGASYVLFSDGTIEVETESGTHRFDSMAHLKDHIERQDAG